ncbi:flippase [Marinomonas gallaica]|uniref:flippase n=1 Tax=Marinomonas gallaica TaxID=1806667 RepID=UPI003A90C982
MSQSLVNKFFGTAGVQILGRGLTVILGIVLARTLGPEEFGRYSFILSLIAIAVIPTIAGMPQLLVREIANAQLDKRWGELKGILNWAMGYIVAVSFVVMLLLALAIEVKWIRPDIGNLLWVGLILIPIRGVLARQNALLNGLRFPVLAQLPQGVLTSFFVLVLVGFILLLGFRVDAYFLLQIQIIASLIGLIISAYFVSSKKPKEIKSITAEYNIKQWHKTLLPFTLLAVISTMNNELASVFLGFLADEESVAYFKVAMQGVTLLALGLAAINTVIAPQISRYYRQGDMVATQELLTKSVRLSALTSLPFALLLIFCSKWIVTLLFGVKYLAAAPIITILCIGQVVNVLMGSVGLVLQMTGNEKKALKALSITMIMTVGLLLILVPLYQAVGAAISVTISMIFWNILMFFDVKRNTGLITIFK